jgi:hypothetical protein
VYIGVEFEGGGCYEDWGFVVVKFNYDKEKDAYKKSVISTGRNLEQAIKKARDKLK